MNKKDYVSLNVAKLLKDKGYEEDENNEISHYGYYCNSSQLRLKDLFDINYYTFIIAPHLYDAQKWLRNKYNLYVTVDIIRDNNFIWTITKNNQKILLCSAKDENNYLELIYNHSYEEALNEGIKQALNYI